MLRNANESTFITRVVIENYKSIAHCDVRLGPLTFLVGRNGSGKSNFLDALAFMADGLRQTLDGAVRARENIGAISRLRSGYFQPLGVRIEFRLPDGRLGSYGFEVGGRSIGTAYALSQEVCSIWEPEAEKDAVFFRVRNGQVQSNVPAMPATLPRHLYLVNASGIGPFQDVYRALAGMRFYHIDPASIQHTMSDGEDELLVEDGSNAAGVLLRLSRQRPAVLARIVEYLQAMVPEILDVATFKFGSQFSLSFKQAGAMDGMRFAAPQMSDGTLRALGILLALFQRTPEDTQFLSLLAMEEPETGLHRAALAAMRDAVSEASETIQILVTTHSTDLLDTKDFDPDWLRVVINEGGITRIGPLSEATQSIVRDHLSTAGELLRSSPLRPLVTSGTSATLFNE